MGKLQVLLASVSRERVQRGFTPSEIASVILYFKKPLFDRLCHELTQNRDALLEQLWLSTTLLDQLDLWVTEIFLKACIAFARFLNRIRPQGWLAPSLQHRVDTTSSNW